MNKLIALRGGWQAIKLPRESYNNYKDLGHPKSEAPLAQ